MQAIGLYNRRVLTNRSRDRGFLWPFCLKLAFFIAVKGEAEDAVTREGRLLILAGLLGLYSLASTAYFYYEIKEQRAVERLLRSNSRYFYTHPRVRILWNYQPPGLPETLAMRRACAPLVRDVVDEEVCEQALDNLYAAGVRAGELPPVRPEPRAE